MTGISDIIIEISQHIMTQIRIRVLPSPLWTPNGYRIPEYLSRPISVTRITDASLESVDNTQAILYTELSIQLAEKLVKKL